jgi:hypothetical protein
MPPRTGLAATVRSLLHELGVLLRPVVAPRRPQPDVALRPADAGNDDTEPPVEPPVSTAVVEPVATVQAAPEARAAAEQPVKPTPPAQAAAKQKTPGRFLRRLQTAALWLRDVGLGATGFVLLVVVATAGFTASFIGLHKFGMTRIHYSDHQAWLVPIAIDGADIGLSVTALRAAMAGRGALLNRIMIFACTSISSWINYTDVDDWSGRRIAALLPVLAVILLEFLLGEARAAHERRNGHQRPRLSLLRWLFDFRGTLAILRAYALGIPLPEQMAVAAETVQAERKAKPRQRRRNADRKPVTKPSPKPARQLPGDAEDQDGEANAASPSPIIDANMVEEFGPKGAQAVSLWLEAVHARRPISLRKIDREIDGNGAARLAVQKYKEKYGDPSREAANA